MAQKELLDSIFFLAIRLFKSERIRAGDILSENGGAIAGKRTCVFQ